MNFMPDNQPDNSQPLNGSNGNGDGKRNPADHLKQYQFPPGTSGNPLGRPKNKTMGELIHLEGKKPLPQHIRDMLKGKELPEGMTQEQFITMVLYQRAMAGDIRFINVILDRVDGKVPIPISIDGDITIEHELDLTRLTDEELNEVDRIRGKMAIRPVAESAEDGLGTGAA